MICSEATASDSKTCRNPAGAAVHQRLPPRVEGGRVVLARVPRADVAPAHAVALVLLGGHRERVLAAGAVGPPHRRVGAGRGSGSPHAAGAAVGSASPHVRALLARAAAARGAAVVPRVERRAGRARVVEIRDRSRTARFPIRNASVRGCAISGSRLPSAPAFFLYDHAARSK